MEPSALPDLCAESSLHSPCTDYAPGKPERVVAWRVPLESACIGFGFQSPPRYQGRGSYRQPHLAASVYRSRPVLGFLNQASAIFGTKAIGAFPAGGAAHFAVYSMSVANQSRKGRSSGSVLLWLTPSPALPADAPLQNSWSPPRGPAVGFHRGESTPLRPP